MRVPTSNRTAMFVVPADLTSLREKGVDAMILDRDEDGFFDLVITVHPFADQERVVELSPRHTVVELRSPRHHRLGRSAAGFAAVTLFHVLRVVWVLRRLIRRYDADIVRATDPTVTGSLAWLGWVLSWRGRFCVSVHTDYAKIGALDVERGAPRVFGSRGVARRVGDFVLRRAELVMPISDHLARRLVTWSTVDPERIAVVHHGLDLSFLDRPPVEVRRQLGLDPDRSIVMFGARLSKENYVDDVLLLAERLSKRVATQVVIAGDGREGDRIRRWVEGDPELRRTVFLLGFQPRELVIDLYRHAAVNICTMSGFALLEACASGAPVVAYDVDWHRELIEDRRTGLLVTEGDIDALAEAVELLLTDRDLAERLGAAARAAVVERFSLQASRRRRVSVYERLLRQATA